MSSLLLRLTALLALVCSFSAMPAFAQSLTGNVGSAGVSEGEQSVEARIGLNSDGDLASRAHYDYGFTSWYQLRVIGAFSQPDGGEFDFTGLTLENWFQWSEEADDDTGFNGGLRFAYTLADDGGPDEAEVRLTATDAFAGDWEWRANLIAEIEAGDGSQGGVFLEARGQLSRGLQASALGSEDWRAGVEIFSEFGNTRDIPGFDEQAHQIGAVVKVSWENGIYAQSAVRTGLSDGSDDTMLKLFVGREF